LCNLVNWLASRLGNLVWDLVLVVATVALIPLVLSRLERRRWRPARQFLYSRLLRTADDVVGLLPEERKSSLGRAAYQFGPNNYSTWLFDEGFIDDLAQMDAAEFEERVKELAGKPELVGSWQHKFDDLLGTSAGVFLASEPELNRLIYEFTEHLSDFDATLERYRSKRTSTQSPSGSDFHVDTMEQAYLALHSLVQIAYELRRWLADQADSVEPSKR
jgi:hypothetical protein